MKPLCLVPVITEPLSQAYTSVGLQMNKFFIASKSATPE